MACPTCGHTMQRVRSKVEESVFWCPRCGTLKDGGDDEAPKLVERCRDFITEVGDDKKHCRGFFPVDIKQQWNRLGIAESINPPKER